MQLWSGRNTHNLDLRAGTVSQNGLHAVWKITSEAIDELHRSLESCPGETAMAEDPAGAAHFHNLKKMSGVGGHKLQRGKDPPEAKFGKQQNPQGPEFLGLLQTVAQPGSLYPTV